jgi:hypothetical protein
VRRIFCPAFGRPDCITRCRERSESKMKRNQVEPLPRKSEKSVALPLEGNAKGARAPNALLEMREEGRRGGGGCEAEAARDADEPALTKNREVRRETRLSTHCATMSAGRPLSNVQDFRRPRKLCPGAKPTRASEA